MSQTQLDRILHMIPAAARPGGATYAELEDALDVTRDQLLRDLETVTTREFYHPAGTATDIQVALESDRVRVWTTGSFQRPVRLDLREAAALHLGLRILADERDDPELVDATRRVREHIAWADPDAGEDDDDAASDAGEAVVAGDPGGRDALRATLVDAARRRRRVELLYLKPDAPGPEPRSLDPYVVAYAEGRTYVIGHDPDRGEPRVFRLDRVLEARVGDRSFTVPDAFDPADFLDRGRVYRADDEMEVTVRYAPRVARWIIERGEGEAREDGSVLVSHMVSDPGWIVREVLRYGPDAEVMAPAEVRGWVRDALRSVLRSVLRSAAPAGEAP